MLKLIAKAEGIKRYHLTSLILILIAWDIIFIVFVIRSAFPHLGPQFIFVVADVLAPTFPKVGAVLAVALRWVYERLHTYLVAWFILLEIHDVEFVLTAFTYVSHGKVVPLRVSRWVEIKVNVAVIFIFIQLFNLTKITWFETAIEENSSILDIIWWEYNGISRKWLWLLTLKLLIKLFEQHLMNLSFLDRMNFRVNCLLIFFKYFFRLFDNFQSSANIWEIFHLWVVVKVMELLRGDQEGFLRR